MCTVIAIIKYRFHYYFCNKLIAITFDIFLCSTSISEVRIRSEHLEDNENYIGGTDPLTTPTGTPTSGGCRQQPPDGDNKS